MCSPQFNTITWHLALRIQYISLPNTPLHSKERSTTSPISVLDVPMTFNLERVLGSNKDGSSDNLPHWSKLNFDLCPFDLQVLLTDNWNSFCPEAALDSLDGTMGEMFVIYDLAYTEPICICISICICIANSCKTTPVHHALIKSPRGDARFRLPPGLQPCQLAFTSAH